MSKLAKTDADKWMQQALAESAKMRHAWQQTKLAALNAGLFFFNARAAVEGDFNEYLACYEDKISRTSVYRWIQFYESALEWAAQEKPSLKSKPALLLEYARKMVMQSPKPFVALMRQLGEMRKFGEYDSVKYAAQKRLSNGSQLQFEFDFSQAASALDLLMHVSEPNFIFKVPEGKTETEAARELQGKLTAALQKLDAFLADAETIET
jgi:hypothetical protein